MMWIGIGIVSLMITLASILYLIVRVGQLGFIKWISKDKKKIQYGISTLLLVSLMVLLTCFISFTNMMVIMMHLFVFWLVMDLIGLLIAFIRRKSVNYYLHCLIIVAVTCLYLSYGWFNLYHVRQTKYTIDTENSVGKGYRIVQISDTHIGTSLDHESFLKQIKKINKKKPDVVVITGDFVDDGTTYNEFMECTKALKELKTRYGVYFIFGNHDKGYGNPKKRGFTEKDIRREMKRNRVKVLEDKSVLINKKFYLIGRQDAIETNRDDMNTLVRKLKNDKYKVVLDHEPNDYEAQQEAGVNLVLSGHTHGGQLIPITYVGEWIGANDMTYGHEKRGNTDFIVSSGMSDWEIKFKTGCKSEYVVIDLK